MRGTKAQGENKWGKQLRDLGCSVTQDINQTSANIQTNICSVFFFLLLLWVINLDFNQINIIYFVLLYTAQPIVPDKRKVETWDLIIIMMQSSLNIAPWYQFYKCTVQVGKCWARPWSKNPLKTLVLSCDLPPYLEYTDIDFTAYVSYFQDVCS